MAEKETTKAIEREYTIPLRNEWRKVANYRRTGRAIKFIKQFIAKHMKIPDRDVSKVKLDVYLNQEVFFRGRKKPPAKLKVKVKKEGDIVHVSLAEAPQHIKFLKLKRSKLHKAVEKTKEAPKPVEKKEEPTQTEEQKKEEKEKSTSAAEQKAAQAEKQAKDQKHVTKVKETKFHRQALKK